MKLIILGINLGQFYAQYALKQYLSIQTEPYMFANFYTESYAKRILGDDIPLYDLKNYIESDWFTGRQIISDLPFSSIDLFFAPVTKGLTAHSISLFQKGTLKNPQKGMSFSNTFKEHKKILLCLDSNLPVTHIINDPLEVDLSSLGIKEVFYYKIPGRASYSDYLTKEIALQPGPRRKTRPFTFGFSNISKSGSRTKYYNEFKSTNLPFFYKGPEEDNYISTYEYNNLLEESRYTYILPAYDSNHFSYIRYLEALHRGCIPLIHPDCNLQWFEGAELQKMKSLITPIKDIKDRIA